MVGMTEQLAGAAEFGDDLALVVARIDAAVDPVHEHVAAGPAVEEIHRAHHLAFVGEIDLDGIVHAATGEGLDLAPTQLRRPDPRGLALLHDLPGVAVGNGETLAAVAPVEASVRMKKGTVDIGGVAGEVEAGRELFAHLGTAIAILVGETPEARRRHHVERIIDPERALGKGQAVGKESRFVEDAVLVGIFDEPDRAWFLREEFLLVQIDARRFRR
jgi:hypothetical protein